MVVSTSTEKQKAQVIKGIQIREANPEIFHTLQQYKEYAESQGLFVYAIMLKGSQNYNLADEESDIDANLIFIPKPSELRANKTYKFEFETGEVTCHNIYSFAEIVAKGNPQWIEVCHTKYHLGKSLDMFKHYKLNPSALKGMIMEKVHAFSKLYPSKASIIKKFGYDPKQLHHIIRLYDCLEKDVDVYEYEGETRDWMMTIKRGGISLAEAGELRDHYLEKLTDIYEERKLKYKPQKVDYEALDKIVLNYYSDGTQSYS